ncbi:MAG: dipeptide ABC transporter ATP-binding protein [Zoogloea sp.]|nr:dipeptide ABC transporter ATP-binding protein [Zoogloea sp.]
MIGFLKSVDGLLPGHQRSGEELLRVDNLQVELGHAERPVRPVDGISLALRESETFALLGESGCGKSMTALALMRLLPAGGRIAGGTVHLAGQDLLALPEAAMRAVRGRQLAMIFQEPATSLNPVMMVGRQIGEVLACHRGLRGAAADEESARLLGAVGIPDPRRRLTEYPFQLSGGMKQRVMIAMALAGEPRVLIADEPTTALDVTIQAQVLDLLAELQASRRMGMLLITHDLGVVARMAHRVGVMYAGELVETGERAAFFAAPLHPYSRKLFASLPTEALRGRVLDTLPGRVPRLDRAFSGCRFADRCPQVHERCHVEIPAMYMVGGREVRCHLYDPASRVDWKTGAALPDAAPAIAEQSGTSLEVHDLKVHFPVRKGVLKRVVGQVKAVDGVSLAVPPGRTLALVGESGCGKTTVGKALLQLIAPTGGSVRFGGRELVGLSQRELRLFRRNLQMVFQDPFGSLNPRMRIGEILEEGMLALNSGSNAAERTERIDGLLRRVGLDPAMRDRFPHEFSGGQRQRIAIARALAVSPRLIVCDEPTSALDVSVQAQILNLLRDLQAEFGLSYLFITHNLAVVGYLAHEVAVMYLGRIVEHGPAEAVLHAPAHPYTRMLLAAVPHIDAARRSGDAGMQATARVPAADLPSPLDPPRGCHFHPRCPQVMDVCREIYPEHTALPDGRVVRCHLHSS